MLFFRWGVTADFWAAIIAYVIIQVLDGNLLAALLLSGAVNTHPVAIIVAILLFGGLWGFLGVFFAIPIATAFHAVIRVWPRTPEDDVARESPTRLEQAEGSAGGG